MKILYVITALGTGGAENLLVDVCSGLVPKNEVTVVFLRDKRDFEKRLNAIGIETVFVDVEKTGALKCI